jgi:3-dehydroquinate synthase
MAKRWRSGEEVRVAALMEHLGLRLWHPALVKPGAGATPAILTGLREFREHLGGELTITLLKSLGEGVEVHAMDPELVMQSIDWLRAREGA